MLRLMGAALLLAGGVLAGMGAAGELDKRVRDLESWETALEGLERELDFRLLPTPDLLAALSRMAPPPAREVFRAAREGMERLGETGFSEIWSGALAARPSALTGEDLALLSRLGQILGRYSGEEQRRSLASLREALKERRRTARESRAGQGRVCRALGAAFGAFLAILLL